MYSDLLIQTGTIQSRTDVNDGGNVTRTYSNVYTGIKMRLNDLSYRDQKFVESRPDFGLVTDKAFVEVGVSGVERGFRLISGGKTYEVVHVKERQDANMVHHYEIYLRIIEHG